MPKPALTIDFWDTLVVAHTNGHKRQQQRLDHLVAIAQRASEATLLPDQIQEAYEQAAHHFRKTWHRDHRTLKTTDLVRDIWQRLSLEISPADHAETVQVFEEGLLYGPPELAAGVPEALEWAASRFRLGIISDTMFSPGRVIRKLLDRYDVLAYFEAFVFSDEVGVSKPDHRAFESAADQLGTPLSALTHIGDLRRTDIAGALQVNARAVLYTGVRTDPGEGPAPTLTLPHWSALPDVLQS